MVRSAETDEGNDAVLHLSLKSLNIHLHAPSGKFSSDPGSTF